MGGNGKAQPRPLVVEQRTETPSPKPSEPTSSSTATPTREGVSKVSEQKMKNVLAQVRRQIFTEQGQVKVDAAIFEMWKKKGPDGDKLVAAMIECDGNKACG